MTADNARFTGVAGTQAVRSQRHVQLLGDRQQLPLERLQQPRRAASQPRAPLRPYRRRRSRDGSIGQRHQRTLVRCRCSKRPATRKPHLSEQALVTSITRAANQLVQPWSVYRRRSQCGSARVRVACEVWGT